MAGGARFCTVCGIAFAEDARFCTTCGAVRADLAPVAPATEYAESFEPADGSADPAAPPTGSLAGAMHTAQAAAGMVGMAAALPWQTLTGDEKPDLTAFLRGAGAPIAQTVLRRSVRTPAVLLLLTTLLDAFVAVISGQPAALSALAYRVGIAGLTALIGLFTGKRGGAGRKLVGVGSLLSAGMQLFTVGRILVTAIGGDAGLLSLLPSLVSAASVLFVAVRTVIMTFRRTRAVSP